MNMFNTATSFPFTPFFFISVDWTVTYKKNT
jgi:hypothetical protein